MFVTYFHSLEFDTLVGLSMPTTPVTPEPTHNVPFLRPLLSTIPTPVVPYFTMLKSHARVAGGTCSSGWGLFISVV